MVKYFKVIPHMHLCVSCFSGLEKTLKKPMNRIAKYFKVVALGHMDLTLYMQHHSGKGDLAKCASATPGKENPITNSKLLIISQCPFHKAKQ